MHRLARFVSCLRRWLGGRLRPAAPDGPRDRPTRRSRPPAPSAEGRSTCSPSEPAGAKGVIDVRKEAKDGDEVVVVGRIGGSDEAVHQGRAAFRSWTRR